MSENAASEVTVTVVDRAGFRQRTVGAQKQFKKVTVDLGDGAMAEVRQPSIKARAAIFKAAKAMGGQEEIELAELQAEAVIRCTFLEDGRPAFEAEDRESLLEQPAGGWFDKLAEKALELLNVDDKELAKK
jgi:hypothetical protein